MKGRITQAELEEGLDARLFEIFKDSTPERIVEYSRAVAIAKIKGFEVDEYITIARELRDIYVVV